MSSPYRAGTASFVDRAARLRGTIVAVDEEVARAVAARDARPRWNTGDEPSMIERLGSEGLAFVCEGHEDCDVRVLAGEVPADERPAAAERVVRSIPLRIPTGRLLIANERALATRSRPDPKDEPLLVELEPGDYRLECWEDALPPSRGAWREEFEQWRTCWSPIMLPLLGGLMIAQAVVLAAHLGQAWLLLITAVQLAALMTHGGAALYFSTREARRPRTRSRMVILLHEDVGSST